MKKSEKLIFFCFLGVFWYQIAWKWWILDEFIWWRPSLLTDTLHTVSNSPHYFFLDFGNYEKHDHETQNSALFGSQLFQLSYFPKIFLILFLGKMYIITNLKKSITSKMHKIDHISLFDFLKLYLYFLWL